MYDATGELFTWSYTFTTGDLGSGLNGSLSNINIDNAKDLAGNPLAALDLDSDDDGTDDILYIDNVVEIATFTYDNITNPELDNVGIAGDTIQVTVTSNQPISATSPVPTIDFEYYTAVDTVKGDIVN